MGNFEHSIIKKRDVPHPTRIGVNIEDWKNEYISRRSDDRDDDVFKAGIWVYNRIYATRKKIDEIVSYFTPRTPILRLAVAEINRRTRDINTKHNETIKNIAEKGMALNPSVAANFKIINNGRNEFPSDNMISLMGDALEHLFRMFRTTPQDIYFMCHHDTLQAIRALVDNMLIISQLEDIWQSCIWLSYNIDEADSVTFLRASHEGIARSVASSQDRFQNNHIAVSAACIKAWKHGQKLEPCIRWVESALVGDGRLSFALSDWSDKDLPPEPYLNRRSALVGIPPRLLETPLSKFEGLTVNELFDGMEALQSLCTLFFTQQCVELDDELGSRWMDSPAVMKSDCVRLVAEACNIENLKATKIIDVLTLVNGNTRDGAWEKPLIPAGNETVYFCFPVLLTSNPVRLVDHWLIEGGISTQEKGSELERAARNELASALVKNKTITDATVYDSGLRLEGNNKPEIDALVRIGKTVIVCEIKSPIFPVTHLEIYKHIRTVFSEGVKQAGEELEMALRHRNRIAECTRYTGNPEDLAFLNAVLVRGRIGSGLTVEHVPILDVELLAQYLTGGVLEFIHDTRAPFESGLEHIVLYDNQLSAEANIEPYLRAPPTEFLRHQHTTNAQVETIDPYDGRKIIADNYIINEISTIEEMHSAIAIVRKRWIECSNSARE